jgi:hypothetical protein
MGRSCAEWKVAGLNEGIGAGLRAPLLLLRRNSSTESVRRRDFQPLSTMLPDKLLPVNRIDDIAIEKLFSPAAGWAEHRLGLSQWRLAMESLNGHLVFYLAGVALTIAGKGMEDGIFTNLLIALAWLSLMEIVRKVARRQAGSSIGVQTARMREWHFRLILLVMLPFSLMQVRGIGNACYSISLFLLVCHLYFKACDTPPPERRTRLAYSRS